MHRGLSALLAGALAITILMIQVVDAQSQPATRLPLIAILETGPAARPSGGVAHFRRSLGELGWVEGRTVRIETRYGEWQPERVDAAARALVALRPDVLYTYSVMGVQAAMKATTTTPIVVGAVDDLVAMGAVKSLAKPGTNVTGVTHAQLELDQKRLELLKEALPYAVRVAFLAVRPPGPAFEGLERAAPRLGVRMQHARAADPGQIDTAFAAMARDGGQAVIVQDGPVFARHPEQVATLALRHRLPTMSQVPGFAGAGGLLQYGADVFELFRRSATHVDRILKGSRPSDLPVEQPTKIELVVNLRTARALGVRLSGSILLRADQVIE